MPHTPATTPVAKRVTHPGTNRAQCRTITLIEYNVLTTGCLMITNFQILGRRKMGAKLGYWARQCSVWVLVKSVVVGSIEMDRNRIFFGFGRNRNYDGLRAPKPKQNP